MGMKGHSISPGLVRWLRQQQLYIAIALAVYAIFWAIDPQRAGLFVTFVYTLLLRIDWAFFMPTGHLPPTGSLTSSCCSPSLP